MTREQLQELHRKITQSAAELMKAKSEDYAAGADPFRNFRRHGLFGICVRLSDKLARLESLLENGEYRVKNESLRDTVMDIVNYAILFYGMYMDEKKLLQDDPLYGREANTNWTSS